MKVNFKCPKCGNEHLDLIVNVSCSKIYRVKKFTDEFVELGKDAKLIQKNKDDIEIESWNCSKCSFNIKERVKLYDRYEDRVFHESHIPDDKFVFNWLKEKGMLE